jgi:predicted nucleic acid-binding protein
VRLVADANVLLSAVTGGRAALILARPDLAEIVTTASAMAEVQEYAGPLARKVGLPLRRQIARRDPDDVDVLALALHLGVDVWSNDSDFDVADVKWHTTAQLLKRFGLGRS